MLDKIIEFAKQNEIIQAALLNGSRVSPSAIPDEYQDYDVIYVVDSVKPFVEDEGWIDTFGQLIIMQKPDEMDGLWPKHKQKFTFLMIFEDGNRIDLTFMQKDKYLKSHIDSQTKVLLDKNNIIPNIPEPNDSDYLPKPPTEKLFKDRCNEFLWCSQNVVKGIKRKELTYAKFMSENVLRGELIKLLTWYAGIKTNHSQNLGAYGKYLEKHIEPELWQKFVNTYVGADYEQMWDALLGMFELFDELAVNISGHFRFEYDRQEYDRVLKYLNSYKNR
jgi:aminoglycoside 6-adenylyltransferase